MGTLCLSMKTKGTILVIDDDTDLRELFLSLLQLKGFNVSAVSSIPADIAINKPDLILLDVLLFGKSGLKICEELKNNDATADIPVIMVSGYTDIREKCLQAGAEDFILKPFDIGDLITSIEKAIRPFAVSG